MSTRFRRLLGLALVGLCAACGGELVGPQGDSGALPDRVGPSVTHPPPVTVVTGGSSGGSSGEPPAGSSGSASSSGDRGEDGPACEANILSHAPGTAFGACWACIVQGCSAQLTACMAECACNEAIEGALTCTDHGEAGSCFLFIVMPVSSDDAVQIAANNCIALKQSPPCPCDMMTPTDD